MSEVKDKFVPQSVGDVTEVDIYRDTPVRLLGKD